MNQTNSSSDNPSSPQQPLTNEIKITMNKKVCELALNSYRNSDEFKQELRQLASQVIKYYIIFEKKKKILINFFFRFKS